MPRQYWKSPCNVIARRPIGPTWARHQPSGLPNARSLCVRLQSVPPALALPLGELSPKVTERACRGGRPCPPKPAGLTRPAEGSGSYEMSTDRTLVGRGPRHAHRRASRLSAAVAPDSRGTSSKSPRFIRHRRRFGDSLPTVVPAGCWPLSRPTAGALPRNRLASSATGGASAILCPPSCQPTLGRCRARQPGHFLEIASLHPPPAALRRFPPNFPCPRKKGGRTDGLSALK